MAQAARRVPARASLLRLCGAPAEHVDHKVRHRGDKALLLSWVNLQSLCAHCHNSIKQRMEERC
ncbi:HNH endonuclease [Paracoccus rhizosphaerae]|uniref:HNH endonuclease n=1 Tax=Paracoccus rhizosphaerae TaxID=1133347 RepID=UPI00361FCE4D